jgi:hypothetical protein
MAASSRHGEVDLALIMLEDAGALRGSGSTPPGEPTRVWSRA